ncbi:asparagine synthase (glutamine-hydrolyzing) [Gammaproteobacteria bacterium]|nr:asparagine synthase (glutamine-hydrolyzing) [Gammaproteobacteria bacterium]|tara:strand:- start:5260 stop:6831 length:1572 start_codon:yes stop_codon:yes gene_type:complete
MCGILLSTNPNISKNKFLSALKLMHHRGPDASGYHHEDNIQLGHQRLKIMDLDERSNQPFRSRNKRYDIVFNGEIYNFKDLAKKYNIDQQTTSDTEVLIELYSEYGPKMLDWLNGMFAFAIYDNVSKDVFVARDRLGVKPLYMNQTDGVLSIASEMSSILELTGVTKFDSVGLRQYRKLRTFYNGKTAYEGIEMFPAGCFMISGKIHKYWEFPIGQQAAPGDDELLHLITESVDQRLLSDVSIGSFLSGGVDSTIIAGLSGKEHTWTVGFESHNEFDWAKMAADNIQSQHHEVLINENEFISLAKVMIQKRREPLSVPNEVLLHKMTSKVKEFNTVILSGEGADELFFGYDRIFRWADSAKEWDLKAFTDLYCYGTHDDMEIMEDVIKPFMHHKKPIDIVAHFFQVAHLHGLLRRLDNSTMLSSVEARVPFVDYHPLIERMAGVPFQHRISNNIVKAPLKRVFKNLLPKPIIDRKKVGFPVPLESIFPSNSSSQSPMDQWLNFNLSELCGSSITESEFYGDIL